MGRNQDRRYQERQASIGRNGTYRPPSRGQRHSEPIPQGGWGWAKRNKLTISIAAAKWLLATKPGLITTGVLTVATLYTVGSLDHHTDKQQAPICDGDRVTITRQTTPRSLTNRVNLDEHTRLTRAGLAQLNPDIIRPNPRAGTGHPSFLMEAKVGQTVCVRVAPLTTSVPAHS